MLKEKERNNIGWTSTADFQTDTGGKVSNFRRGIQDSGSDCQTHSRCHRRVSACHHPRPNGDASLVSIVVDLEPYGSTSKCTCTVHVRSTCTIVYQVLVYYYD